MTNISPTEYNGGNDGTCSPASDASSGFEKSNRNRKHRTEYQRYWRNSLNPEGIKKENAYYAKNSSHIQARKKARRPDNIDRIMFRSARQRAKSRGIPFYLSYEDIKVPLLCPIFKVPLKIGTKYAPSLDRIIPELGYVKGNIQVISRLANQMKQNATAEELNKFAQWVIFSN